MYKNFVYRKGVWVVGSHLAYLPESYFLFTNYTNLTPCKNTSILEGTKWQDLPADEKK